MSSFRDAYLTNNGADLIAEAVAEGIKIEFVKMVVGDGEYEDAEKSKDALQRRTELKSQRQECGFSSVEATTENAVKLKAIISNMNVTEGYRIREIGIIAKKSGDTTTEGILYSVAVAEEADYLPSEDTPISYIQEYYTKVSNAESVVINVSMDAYATAEDVERLSKPTYEEPESLEELTSGEKLETAFGKIKKAVSELISHIGNKKNPHGVTKEQIGLGNAENTSDADKPVSNAVQEALDIYYTQLTAYADKAIADLINGAPTTLDTLKELADAINDNKSITDALDEAIGKKANADELGAAAYKRVANNDTTTVDGYVADARVVKEHGDEIDALNTNLNKIGTYITANGDYVNVPADGTEHMIASINIDSGIWVITANIICWVTSGTNIYTRLFDSNGVERHYSVGSENNIVTTVILKTDAHTTVPVFVAHDDTNGARTFIATLIKAVRII